MLKIGTTTIHKKAINTLGLEIISKELEKAGYDVLTVDKKTARHVDVLLVSLYWIDQVLEFPKFLIQSKINPKEKKPLIIIGGSMCFNLWPMEGFYHYAVIGDGENNITVNLIKKIEAGEDPETESVVSAENFQRGIKPAVSPFLSADHYIELRTNKTTRIEIARGCKMKCGFCQLTHIKPYREIAPIVLKNLIATAPTKTVALFAPDRGSYSGFNDIERWCKKYGKTNTGTDVRLKSLQNVDIVSSVRFGIEGFSEKERALVNKPYKSHNIVNDVCRVFQQIRTPKNKEITNVLWYMLLGLPGQNENDYKEFMDLLFQLDEKLRGDGKKKTIFLTLNDFLPMNHTPMERTHKDIYTDHMKIWLDINKPLKNITTAMHGGSRSPSRRLSYLLVSRGGVGSGKAIFNLMLNNSGLLGDRSEGAAKKVIKIFEACGVDVNQIINGYSKDQPWDNIQYPKICESEGCVDGPI